LRQAYDYWQNQPGNYPARAGGWADPAPSPRWPGGRRVVIRKGPVTVAEAIWRVVRGERAGWPFGAPPGTLPHPFSPAEFLRGWSAAERALPLSGRDRPLHAPPKRRLPAEHHMFLGTDMLLGVTPNASGYEVGQRPVVHRLQSLPRPPCGGRGLAAGVGQAPDPPGRGA